MNKMDFFVNERMKVLIALYNHQINIAGVEMSPISQQEIADLVKCSKVKVNQIVRELIEQGYLETYHSKGRYILTEKAKEVVGIVIAND